MVIWINRYTLLSIKYLNNKDPLYSTENNIQSLMIEHDGR